MNTPISLASLRAAPVTPGGFNSPHQPSGPEDVHFGKLLEHASSHAPQRPEPGRTGRSQSKQREPVHEPRRQTDRNDRTRNSDSKRKAVVDDSLAGACAVTAPPAPIEPTTDQPSPSVTRDNAEAVTTETSTDTGENVESAPTATVEEGTMLANGRMLTSSTAKSLTEALTPVAEEQMQVELPSAASLATATATATEAEATAANESATQATTASIVESEAPSLASDPAATEEAAAPAALTALAGDAATPPEDARRNARAARRAWLESLETPRGIAAAEMDQAMKTNSKQEVPAGRGVNILPGTAAIPVPPLPKLPAEVARPANTELSADALAAAAKLSPAPVRADVADAPAAELRPLAPMARIADVISREVRMFKRAADDLLEVVLTPDAKTQISLRLQWREGQVEAQARCDFGDYKSLNLQWPQLQAALAAQGVKLSHLSERPQSGFTDFFNQPGFGHSQRDSSRETSVHSPQSAVHSPQPGLGTRDSRLRTRDSGRPNPLLERWA